MKNQETSNQYRWLVFAFVVVISLLLQYLLLRAADLHIRTEEISESVRNVWWFINGQVFHGANAHIGWYAPLAILYKIFGFSFVVARWYRFFLHAVSIIAAAILIKKYIGYRFGSILLASWAWSPTLLAFNAQALGLGIDLQFLPLCLLFLDKAVENKNGFSLIFLGLSAMIAMIAALSYPTFLYYIPVLILLYSFGVKRLLWNQVGVGIASFLLPLLLGIVYIQNRSLLLFDSGNGAGLFRGAGAIQVTRTLFWERIVQTISTLIVNTPSYYYEVQFSDFSHIIPAFGIIVALSVVFIYRKTNKKVRVWGGLLCLLFFLCALVVGLTRDPSGFVSNMRRGTGIITVAYGTIALCLYIISQKKWIAWVWVIWIFFACIPLHHLLVYEKNRVVIEKGIDQEQSWFGDTSHNPMDILSSYVARITRKDIYVACEGAVDESSNCLYVNVYSPIQMYCLYNHVSCHRMWARDLVTQMDIPLTFSAWDGALVREKYGDIPNAR